ncbi:MAG: hypothetical protein ACKVQW_15145, partial [Pyrinomonadaceae bacterium]
QRQRRRSRLHCRAVNGKILRYTTLAVFGPPFFAFKEARSENALVLSLERAKCASPRRPIFGGLDLIASP